MLLSGSFSSVPSSYQVHGCFLRGFGSAVNSIQGIFSFQILYFFFRTSFRTFLDFSFLHLVRDFFYILCVFLRCFTISILRSPSANSATVILWSA